MEKLDLTQMITISLSDEECVHNYPTSIKVFKKVLMDGVPQCPRCYVENQNKALETEASEFVKNREYEIKKDTLLNLSILDDETILEARILNYLTECNETKLAKEKANNCISEYLAGKKFNMFLQGTPGAGKSHLGYAILKAINETDFDGSCLFVSIEKMIRMIKNSFNDKSSQYSEEYFVNLLSNVDFLVMDDLGAETGSIDTNKTATDFVSRILYAVYNARQGKSTITTTNLSGESMYQLYDKKTISRMSSNCTYIIFKEISDKRKKLPF
ncbi:DnaA ATPase domain-containing protein [Gottfriedia acidiceleris]|uniref:DnaA ATPase domain-containing protein n=1 Tax=Gottfriedia acidiceleris TaxID=371036 RepID=UPI0013ED3607|nr:DnaA/Hda family protein [Gottfriedia acidiceleris]